jgi:hypothetical protein
MPAVIRGRWGEGQLVGAKDVDVNPWNLALLIATPSGLWAGVGPWPG